MSRRSNISRIISNAALALMAIAALSDCAVVGNPDGGPYDETPPRITGSSPQNGATGFKGHKITIDFDEFIKLENASEKVVISPPQTEQPEIKVTGKKIQVELFDTLKPNTTYSIDFADGIKDNNEGNPLGDYCFRFSTGTEIDTLEVSGYVLDAENLEPIKGITVGLHSDLSDSAFITKPFERVSRTDESGHFTVRGIAPGTYRIYAVMDMDQTFSFSQRSEMIAWMDSVIVPSAKPDILTDSTYSQSGRMDSLIYIPYTHFLPDDITLLAFKPAPDQQYMTAADRSTHERFTLRFALPLDSMPQVKGLNFNDSNAYVLQHSARYDTLTFWMKDTMVYYMDTLRMSVSYMATDTTGVLAMTTDTLSLIPKKSRERILRELALEKEEKQKNIDKQIKRFERNGDTLAILELLKPQPEFMDVFVTSGSGMSLYNPIMVKFKEPVEMPDTSVHVYLKADTVWNSVPFDLEQDTLNILNYRIYAEWKPGETFKICIDSASVHGLYGLTNDFKEATLQFSTLDKYSTLTVNVANPKPGYIVRLHDSKGSVVRTGQLENGSVDFFLLKPSTYYVSMFHDANGNGKWDVGEYSEKRQPESVWYISREWALKQDWTHETELWDVTEVPVYDQKPEKLLKSKTKKKTTDIHKKNLERLEKKASQIESEKNKKARKKAERQERRQKNREKYRNR